MKMTDGATIPTDWRSAIEAAKRSDFLKEALGGTAPHLHRHQGGGICARVRTVSEVDFDLYLHTV